MTTASNPGCTCGAHNFGPGAAHLENCYISLAKEAEAVQGVPVRDLGREKQTITANDVATVSAAQMAGQQPVNPPAPADDLYVPEPQRRRQAVADPGPETEFCKIRFVPGLPETLIETYNTDGKPSIIQAGRVVGELVNVREIDTNYGPGTALDIKLKHENPEINGIVAGCFASSMLRRMIQKVRVGSNIEIIRIPSVERWHVYEVYVLD